MHLTIIILQPKDNYMQIIIQLDDDFNRQLSVIQAQTNQDHNMVIQQAISLYYQQIQPHCQVRLVDANQLELVSSSAANISAIN
jgi:hypothetical protein